MTSNSSTAFEPPVTAPPDRHPHKPRIQFPPLACDSHAHICGPIARYPYYERRIYTPSDALLPEYEHMLKTIGVERAVLVQGSIYGSDNTVLLEALKNGRGRYRGVAVVTPDVAESELRRLHEAGVRGIRMNIVDTKDNKGVLPMATLLPLANKIKPFGWHVEFLLHVDEFPDLDRTLEEFPVDVSFGHLGYMRTDKPIDTPGFQALLRLLKTGKAWVKLTAPYRISPHPMPHADTNAFAHALIAANADRVVWGSDWSHIMLDWKIPMPNDGDIADLLAAWAPDVAMRKKILVDNPATLYGFDHV
jgi:predicted TIM-barrel fold metal-dependent hydrolase